MLTANESLTERLSRWVQLTEQKRQLQAELKPIEDELSSLEEPLVEALTSEGVESVKINGMLVYKQREFFAKIKDGHEKGQVFKRLQDEGLTNCLQLGYQTLRGLAREWMEEGEGAPAVITECLELGDVFRLRARKA